MFRTFRAGRCCGCPQRSRGVSGHRMHDTGFTKSICAALEKTRPARALILLVVLLITAPPALAYSYGSSHEGEFVGAANGRLPANAVGVAWYGFKTQAHENLERSFSTEMREEERFRRLPVTDDPVSPCPDGVDRKVKMSPDNTNRLSDLISWFMRLLSIGVKWKLESNHEKWKAQGISDYCMRLEVVCFCDLARRGPFIVDVRQGKVVKAAYAADGWPVPSDIICDIPTIEDLFEIIRMQIDELVIDVEATYDDRLGYPTFTASEWPGLMDTYVSYVVERLDVYK